MNGKEIKCENCGEVVIVLAKGSKVKPDIYVEHYKCPTNSRKEEDCDYNGANDGILGVFRDIGLSV
jgi:hypothetical protein